MSTYTLIKQALQLTIESTCLGPLADTDNPLATDVITVLDYLRDDVNLVYFNVQHVSNVWNHLRSLRRDGEDLALLVLTLTQRFDFFVNALSDNTIDWIDLPIQSLQTATALNVEGEINAERLSSPTLIQEAFHQNPWFAFLVVCDLFHYQLKVDEVRSPSSEKLPK